MFGLNKRKNDSLPVAVHVVRSAKAFAAAQRVWDTNARTIFTDRQSGKELLHFFITSPDTIIWLERDIGRQDVFELIMSWAENNRSVADVFVILSGSEEEGDDAFSRQVLNALLSTPATVPLATKGE